MPWGHGMSGQIILSQRACMGIGYGDEALGRFERGRCMSNHEASCEMPGGFRWCSISCFESTGPSRAGGLAQLSSVRSPIYQG